VPVVWADNCGHRQQAGQVLIQNGLFTLTQLQQLRAVAPVVPPPGEVNLSWLRAFDAKNQWMQKTQQCGTGSG
jgi:hypothetical protein